jgi:hypothetical protein
MEYCSDLVSLSPTLSLTSNSDKVRDKVGDKVCRINAEGAARLACVTRLLGERQTRFGRVPLPHDSTTRTYPPGLTRPA